MKKAFLLLPITLISLSSCSFVKSLEHEVEVNFLYREEVISTTVVTEFNNGLIPELSEGRIPEGYELYGWTWYDPDIISINDPNFSHFYIPYDEVVHYVDVKDVATDGKIDLRPLFINENDIPLPDYYLAIGWYARTSTSGVSQESMDVWKVDLDEFLVSELSATEENISKIHIEGFDGNVATAGANINKARYIDILIGFGNNINTQGGVEVIEKSDPIIMGGKERRVCLLRETTVARRVYTWLTQEGGAEALA